MKKRNRKLFGILPVFALVFASIGLVGCNKTDEPNNPMDNESEEDDETTSSTNPNESDEDEKGEDEWTWEDDGVFRILLVGNSFSDDTLWDVYDVANSLGIEKMELGIMYVASCTLDLHQQYAERDSHVYEFRLNTSGNWETTYNYSLKDAFAHTNWDYVSFQQQSVQAGQPDSIGSNLDYLIDYAKKYLPDSNHTKIIWNMTWAYKNGSTEGEMDVYYGSDQITMYEAVISTAQEKILTRDDIEFIIPTGTAVQNARSSYMGDNLNRDTNHLDYGIGRYITALTLVHKVLGLDISKVTYIPDGVNEKQAQVAVESAINAVAHPFEITQSQYI